MNALKKINLGIVFIFVFLLLLSIKSSFSQYPQLFKGPRLAGSGIDGSISDACAVDVNNDGDLDLVAVYPAGPELAVCYNNGDASFSKPWYVNENVGTADMPQSIAVGDLNNDGYIDLVTATWNGFFGVAGDENSVAINLNSGDGKFSKAFMVPVLDRTTEVITGDFDNDNDIDIAATHRDSLYISILLNNGDATFAPFQYYKISEGAWTLYSADINDDKFLDVIVATTSGVLNLLINHGNGSFTANSISLDSGLQNVHGGDIDKDGDIDLITLNSTTNIIRFFSNDGSGIFTELGSIKVDHWVNSVFLSDFTNDGNLDFCVANYDTSTVTVFSGNGSFSFTEIGEWLIGSNPHDIFAADMNKDGLNDIISCANNLWATTILNNGDATFEVVDKIFDVDPEPIAIDAADFNGDGIKDLILYHYSWSSTFLSVLFNDGFGNFLNTIKIGGKAVDNDRPMGSGFPFTISDFDNDGDIDIVAAMSNTTSQIPPIFFKVFKNDGLGSFNRIDMIYEVPNYMGNKINFIKSTDIDLDSDLDVIVTWGSGAEWGPAGISVFYNDGTANFDSVYCDTIFTDYYRWVGPNGLAVADFTGDTYPDIIIPIPREPFGRANIVLTTNIGNGLFNNPEIIKSELYNCSYFFSSDFEGDSDVDFGMIYQTTALVSSKGKITLNNGDGTFSEGSSLFFPGQSPSWAETCDIDMDGDIDVIGCTNWDQLITVNLNDGNGFFNESYILQFFLPHHPISLVLADVNNDGFTDVATVGDKSITILINALDNPVPVELFSFQASFIENYIKLEWSTASESNNYGFVIERSRNNKSFEKIGFVQGCGTGNSIRIYQFIDNNIIEDQYFYRLKQIDYNGSFKYSDVVQIKVGTPQTFGLGQNYPNPFNPETTIQYQLPKSSHVKLSIFNLLGQSVTVLVDQKQQSGYYSVKWDGKNQKGNDLASGIYVFCLQTQDFIKFRKLTIIR